MHIGQHTIPNYKLPELWQHQKDALEKAKNKFALFFDPGCGKTRTAIELFKRNTQTYTKTIIFAPLNVCRNWLNELEQYLQLPYKTYLVAGQSKAKKIGILEEFLHDKAHVKNEHLFLICNIESLRSKDYLALLGKSSATYLIVDESHNFKSPTSLQTRGLFTLTKFLNPQFIYLLTGTPAPQGEIDLWSTLTLLGKTTDNFFVWRKKYFDDKNEARRGMNNYWPDYKIRTSGRVEIQHALSECSLTANKNLVLDLPPLLRTQLYCDMSPEQRRHYQSMYDYLFAVDSNGEELTATNFLFRTLRLQQILAGFVGDTPMIDNSRLSALRDAIDLTGNEQFLVWTIFKATYGQIAKELEKQNISFGMLTGEQTAEERHQAMEDFQAGRLRALIAHPKAGGVGVNLTRASYSIHYTRSFSLTDDLQAEARNYRGGSEMHKRITRIDIITPGTLDEEISQALREKKSVQDFILGLKEKRMQGGVNGKD